MSATHNRSLYCNPTVSFHAAEEFEKRFPHADTSLDAAWQCGLHAEAPDKHYHEARYYPPADLLMTCKSGVITTVMFASKTRVYTPGAVECGDCGHPHEPVLTSETCPWCGASAEAGRSTGAVTLTVKGDH